MALYEPAASCRLGKRVRFSMWRRFSLVPGEDVRAAGELVVLVRLVDRDPYAGPRECSRLELAHGRVHEVLAARRRASRSTVRELQRRPQAEGGAQIAHTTRDWRPRPTPRRGPPRSRRPPDRRARASAIVAAAARPGSPAPPRQSAAGVRHARRGDIGSGLVVGDISQGVNSAALIAGLSALGRGARPIGRGLRKRGSCAVNSDRAADGHRTRRTTAARPDLVRSE